MVICLNARFYLIGIKSICQSDQLRLILQCLTKFSVSSPTVLVICYFVYVLHGI